MAFGVTGIRDLQIEKKNEDSWGYYRLIGFISIYLLVL